jgi:hypothetical protein
MTTFNKVGEDVVVDCFKTAGTEVNHEESRSGYPKFSRDCNGGPPEYEEEATPHLPSQLPWFAYIWDGAVETDVFFLRLCLMSSGM